MSGSIEEVRNQLANLGVVESFGSKKEIRELPNVLRPGETIKALTSGMLNGHTWVIVCTDRRVIFLDKGMLYGLRQVETPLDKVNSISHKTGLVFGEISIWDGSSQMKIENVPKKAVLSFVQALNAAMEAARRAAAPEASGQSAMVDVASQLEKLASLKERGVLTQEEFEHQKKRLLGM